MSCQSQLGTTSCGRWSGVSVAYGMMSVDPQSATISEKGCPVRAWRFAAPLSDGSRTSAERKLLSLVAKNAYKRLDICPILTSRCPCR